MCVCVLPHIYVYRCVCVCVCAASRAFIYLPLLILGNFSELLAALCDLLQRLTQQREVVVEILHVCRHPLCAPPLPHWRCGRCLRFILVGVDHVEVGAREEERQILCVCGTTRGQHVASEALGTAFVFLSFIRKKKHFFCRKKSQPLTWFSDISLHRPSPVFILLKINTPLSHEIMNY